MKGFTRYLRRSRVFLGATEGDFIDICAVRGMFCVVGEGRFAHAMYVVHGCFAELQKAVSSIVASFAACFA